MTDPPLLLSILIHAPPPHPTKGALDGHRLLREGKVTPDRGPGPVGVFCSAQYHRVYSTTRVPGEAEDKLHTYLNSLVLFPL
jgi:hypothetical protein